MRTISIVFCSLVLATCVQAKSNDVVKPFVAKQVSTIALDMSKEKKDRSGFFPARKGDQLFGKFYNTYSVPVAVDRIEFPATKNGTCSLKSSNPIVVAPNSIAEVEFFDISTLAECHPDLIIHYGAEFIGIPTNKDYSDFTRTMGVMLQYDESIYKSHSTIKTTYPLVFDINKMRLQ